MKKWLKILRAYSWPASLTPVLVGSAVAARNGSFSWADLCLIAQAALLIHSAANLANSYFDFKKGVDEAATADDRALVDGLVKPGTALRAALAMLAAGAAIGLFLAWKNALPLLLWYGAAGIALAWFYTGGPGYKYRALGDAGIFLAFGPLITSGTALIQAGRFVPEALWASVPMGMVITAIVHANNMRDLATDRGAGVRTLAGLLGPELSLKLYYFLAFCPYLFTFTFGSIWPPVFCALSAPLAIRLKERASRAEFSALVPATAKFTAVYGLLLCCGLYMSY